jgi:uncharacterized protein YqgC (DUF456 family)
VNEALLNLLVGLALLVAAAGIVVPILPGTLLALGALLVWAILTGGATAWIAFAIMAAVIGLGQVLKYLLPHRTMSAAGVPGRSILVGGIAAIVGFFVIPFVGLIVGFIGGVYVAEHSRLRDWEAARGSTWVAMKATGFSILIELAAVLVAGTIWAGAAIATT